jgi:hypothetical protein
MKFLSAKKRSSLPYLRDVDDGLAIKKTGVSKVSWLHLFVLS